MKRIALIVATGLLGSVVIHIIAVLAFPAFGGRDLWVELDEFGPPATFASIPIPAPDAEGLAFLDPNMVHAVCRADLSDAPHRVVIDMDVPFWSIGVLDRRGRSLYGLNSGAVGDAGLDLLLIASRDLEALRRAPPAVLEEAVIVDLAAAPTIVVLRVFAPDPIAAADVARKIGDLQCAAPIDLSSDPGQTPEALPGPTD